MAADEACESGSNGARRRELACGAPGVFAWTVLGEVSRAASPRGWGSARRTWGGKFVVRSSEFGCGRGRSKRDQGRVVRARYEGPAARRKRAMLAAVERGWAGQVGVVLGGRGPEWCGFQRAQFRVVGFLGRAGHGNLVGLGPSPPARRVEGVERGFEVGTAWRGDLVGKPGRDVKVAERTTVRAGHVEAFPAPATPPPDQAARVTVPRRGGLWCGQAHLPRTLSSGPLQYHLVTTVCHFFLCHWLPRVYPVPVCSASPVLTCCHLACLFSPV